MSHSASEREFLVSDRQSITQKLRINDSVLSFEALFVVLAIVLSLFYLVRLNILRPISSNESHNEINRFCFTEKGDANKVLHLHNPSEQTNNWILMLTKGISSAWHLNCSTLYLDVGFYNITLGFFDPESIPDRDCWDIRFGTPPERKEIVDYHGRDALQKPTKGADPVPCPTIESQLLANGLLVPRPHIRNKVDKFRESLPNSTIVSVHYRLCNFKANPEFRSLAREKLKPEYADHVETILDYGLNASNIETALRDLNMSIKNVTILVTGHNMNTANAVSILSLPNTIRIPDWDHGESLLANGVPKETADEYNLDYGEKNGVIGDMWLHSFSDVLIYNPQSTAARTMALWNVLNYPEGKTWPSPFMYVGKNISTPKTEVPVMCKIAVSHRKRKLSVTEKSRSKSEENEGNTVFAI